MAPRKKRSAAGGPPSPKLEHPAWIAAADLSPQVAAWLWRGLLPLGGITMLDGDPGLGKSTICFDLAARVTRGQAMPDKADPHLGPGGVIYLGGEDDPETTVLPRLIAAGADLTRVATPRRRDAAGNRLAQMYLPRLCQSVCDIAMQINARLIVLDPWESWLPPELSPYVGANVRYALGPLAELSHELQFAVLGVRHPTKNQSAKAIHRGGGSVAVSGLARVVIAVEADRKESSRRVLSGVKNNLGPLYPPLGYEIKVAGEQATIHWRGKVDQSVGDPVTAAEERARLTVHQEARQLIRAALDDGPKPARDLLAEGERAGIAPRTMQAARASCEVRTKRVNGPQGFYQEWIPPAKWPADLRKLEG